MRELKEWKPEYRLNTCIECGHYLHVSTCTVLNCYCSEGVGRFGVPHDTVQRQEPGRIDNQTTQGPAQGYCDKSPDRPVQTKETINHPSHYGGDTVYEAIKVIEAWHLNFNLGNAVKYICRHDQKGTALQDLKKALWYLQREIANREKI